MLQERGHSPDKWEQRTQDLVMGQSLGSLSWSVWTVEGAEAQL